MKNERVIDDHMTLLLLFIIVPPILFATVEAIPQDAPLVWFFSFIPSVATEHASISALVLGLLGQWLAITFVSFQMVKQLRNAGRSETKRLFDKSDRL